jgi:cob(I)alamin adenosyltransferase
MERALARSFLFPAAKGPQVNAEKGLLIVFTGNGKGKTTAALGMAVRAAGHEMKVLVLQFIKGGWSYGELQSFETMEHITIKPLGTGFTWNKESLEEDRKLAAAGWEEAVSEIARGYYQMIVLDELNIVLSYGLLPLEPVLSVLESRPPGLHIVVTGRNAPLELIGIADLVTEMQQVKHPFHEQGIKAQKGIEF